MRSVRSRLIVGAVLWTAGLFGLAGLALTAAMLRHPHVPVVVHAVFLHSAAVVIVAVLCLAAGFAEVLGALTSLQRLRRGVLAVRAGSRRVEGRFPAEVGPLVADLNALLDHRERVVRRAMATAGDLAHGLKTPLALLAQEADRADAAGHTDLAVSMRQQIERMGTQIDYHLAHARAAASGATPGAHTPVAPVIDALIRTMHRLHSSRRVVVDLDVAPSQSVRVEQQDLEEMLGNLLDNAFKWAASRVRITTAPDDGFVAIAVEDDGPGLAAEMRARVLERGVRGDEAAPGSGLGLAIVRDLVELYGGSIELDAGGNGGVRARIRLPA